MAGTLDDATRVELYRIGFAAAAGEFQRVANNGTIVDPAAMQLLSAISIICQDPDDGNTQEDTGGGESATS